MRIATESVDNVGLSGISVYRTHADSPANGMYVHTEEVAREKARQNFRVALVCMPFERATAPSLQVGLLKAICRGAGFDTDDHYFTMELAARIGFANYREIMGSQYIGFNGDWLASVAAFGDRASRDDYFAAYPEFADLIMASIGKEVPYVNDVRERVMPGFLDDCLEGTDWGRYHTVVFVTQYQQNVASLALARRIKERFPNVAVVFCGKNMDGPMGAEFVRAFPYLDYAICGEHEEAVPELLDRLAQGLEPYDVLGVAARREDGVSFSGLAKPIADLDNLPTPDYDTFYRAAQQFDLRKEVNGLSDITLKALEFGIPIEGVRGCWWAEKSHCSFCSGPLATPSSRRKSSARLLAEADELSARYGIREFSGQDLILDMPHIKGFFEPLAERADDYEAFWCLKANLTRNQMRTLAQGGLKATVIGIESFNERKLKQMRKGVAKLQNINVLRWGTYYGLRLVWNLIYGFPGETTEDFTQELGILHLIHHVHAPHRCMRIRLERFSPFFTGSEPLPMKWRRPARAYDFIYPPELDMEAAAFHFDYEPEEDLADEAYQPNHDFVQQWQRNWKQPQLHAKLTYRRDESELLIEDTRYDLKQPQTYTLRGPDADLYETCSDAPRTPAQICTALTLDCPGFRPNEDEVTMACEAICEAGLMIGEAGKYLSLALPADPEDWRMAAALAG